MRRTTASTTWSPWGPTGSGCCAWTTPGAYLQAEVDLLADDTGDEASAGLAFAAVQEAFLAYLEVLAQRGATRVNVPELPDEPVLLSYVVAASMVVDLTEKQALLAEPDALQRLTPSGRCSQGDDAAAHAYLDASRRPAQHPVQPELTDQVSGRRPGRRPR